MAKFVQQLLGEDPDFEMDREKQRQARDTRTDVLDILGVTGKAAEKTKAASDGPCLLTRMVMANLKELDCSTIGTWEEFDVAIGAEDSAYNSVTNLTHGFSAILVNMLAMGQDPNPMQLRQVVRDFRKRLDGIKIKARRHTKGKKSISDMVKEKVPALKALKVYDPAQIAISRIKGLTPSEVKYILS